MLRIGRAAAGALALVLAFASAALVGMPSAQAAPRLQVSPASGLSPAGATVTVTGSGYATAGNGIYVGWCRVMAEVWKSQDNCAAALWVHVGGAGAGQAPLSAAGAFTVQLRVTGTIGSTSCLGIAACAITTVAAHGSSDRSQDGYAKVSFATAQTAKPPAQTTPVKTVPAPQTTSAQPPATTAPATTSAAASTSARATTSAPVRSSTPPPASSAPPSSAAPTETPALSPVADGTGEKSGGTSGSLWAGLLIALLAVSVGVGLFVRRRKS